MPNIAIDDKEIAQFCRRNHIRRLALFGSVVREDFSSISDVDVLVEFDSRHTPGLAFFHMQDELSQMIGRRVDLHTPQSISKHFRKDVMSDTVVLNEQT
jgi:hypothetical protein